MIVESKSKLVGIVSPPYENIEIGKGLNTKPPRAGHNDQSGRSASAASQLETKYSSDPSNIGNLPDTPALVGIVSPPYSGQNQRDIDKEPYGSNVIGGLKRNITQTKSYSEDMSNIGNLPDALAVSEPLDIEVFCGCGELYWFGCYEGDARYKRYVTAESFAHPAKMSWALLKRVYDHLEVLGLLKREDCVIDFMAGSGRTSVMAGIRGYRSVNVELEPHFVKMIESNRLQTEKMLSRSVQTEVLQGDARNLSTLLTEKGYVGIISPPYQDMLNSEKNGIDLSKLKFGEHSQVVNPLRYSNSDRNIGNLPDKPSLVGITSPPYEAAHSAEGNPGGIVLTNRKDLQKYLWTRGNQGTSEGQLSNEEGESYLSAMAKVYGEAFKSGVSPLVVVTKNPTRKGQLRRLDLDTAKLLLAAGYQIIDYHRAVLFRMHEQATLDGAKITNYKGRLSFFKRLSLEKGNVAAQWEDIIIAAIPNTHGLAGITSPPPTINRETNLT